MLKQLNQRTPLRAKLFGGFGLMIVLAFVTGGTSVILSSRSAEQTQSLLQGPVAERASAERARSSLFAASEIQKGFFLDRDVSELGAFSKAVEGVDRELTALTQMERSEYWQPKVETAKAELETYKNLFAQVTELMKTRGLSETEGLEGELRSAVHQVEESLADTEHDKLTVLLLMCRRHEKDYLMRGDAEKYIGRIAQRLHRICGRAVFEEVELVAGAQESRDRSRLVIAPPVFQIGEGERLKRQARRAVIGVAHGRAHIDRENAGKDENSESAGDADREGQRKRKGDLAKASQIEPRAAVIGWNRA